MAKHLQHLRDVQNVKKKFHFLNLGNYQYYQENLIKSYTEYGHSLIYQKSKSFKKNFLDSEQGKWLKRYANEWYKNNQPYYELSEYKFSEEKRKIHPIRSYNFY